MEFTLGDESEKSKKKEMSSAELTKQLERLIQDKADNQRIFDWVEVCAPACLFSVISWPPVLFPLMIFNLFKSVEAHDFIC